MTHGGLKFERSGDGAVITIHDGTAENSPAVRTVFFSAEEWAAIVEATTTVQVKEEVLPVKEEEVPQGKPLTQKEAKAASESLVDQLTQVVDDEVPNE